MYNATILVICLYSLSLNAFFHALYDYNKDSKLDIFISLLLFIILIYLHSQRQIISRLHFIVFFSLLSLSCYISILKFVLSPLESLNLLLALLIIKSLITMKKINIFLILSILSLILLFDFYLHTVIHPLIFFQICTITLLSMPKRGLEPPQNNTFIRL